MSCNILTPAEVRGRLRCSPQHVYDLVRRGRLRAFRTGSRLRIYADSLTAYLAEQEVTPRRPAPSPPCGAVDYSAVDWATLRLPR